MFCAELQTAEKNALVPFKFPLKERYDKLRRELPTGAEPRANASNVPKQTKPANANLDKGPALSNTDLPAPVGNDPVVEESRHSWTRTDRNAQRFQSTQDSLGPAWENVVRRVTIDIDTNMVVEDRSDLQTADPVELFAVLPSGVRNIRTVLYHNDDSLPGVREKTEAKRVKAPEALIQPEENQAPEAGGDPRPTSTTAIVPLTDPNEVPNLEPDDWRRWKLPDSEDAPLNPNVEKLPNGDTIVYGRYCRKRSGSNRVEHMA